MQYRIVRPEDLDRITLAVVPDASGADAAIQQVPASVALPYRVIVVAPGDTPAVVQRIPEAGPTVPPSEPPEVIPEPAPEDPESPPEPIEEPEVPMEEPAAFPEGDPSDAWTREQLDSFMLVTYPDAEITGTGANGNILKQDLLDYIAAQASQG